MRVAPLLLLTAACQQSPSPSPAASSSAPASSAAPAPPPAPARAWFEGAWQGVFQAELLRVQTVGGVKAWKEDDGKQASGEGKLSLQAAADGTVTGTASGALGALAVAGRIDGDRAALNFSSADPNGFHGVILASQTPEGMKGTLNGSSGDSLQVRQATVTLTRAAP